MQEDRRLIRNLSPLGAWAFSIGTSIGWGSLVVTSNTYLAQAGPLGSTVGMIAGHNAGGFGIVVCDLNVLKLINDEFGHKAGDEHIRQASQVICKLFSHSRCTATAATNSWWSSQVGTTRSGSSWCRRFTTGPWRTSPQGMW